jgi:tRNA threonylcarbamoyl adenosine modification protein YjeE
MTRESVVLNGERAFAEFARRFAAGLRPGMTVALSGGLGAGKTSFVRAVVEALHGAQAVHSPTFTLWHRYEGNPPIDHLDFYRIDDPRELPELGLDEAFGDTSIALIEWADRIPSAVPADAIRVGITGSGRSPREVRVERP